MTQDTLGPALDAIKDHVDRAPIRRHVLRQRIYRQQCCVVDVDYSGARFSFDIVPAGADLFALDYVPRKGWRKLGPEGAGFARKMRIAGPVPLGAALDRMDTTFARLCALVDGPAPAAAGPGAPPGAPMRVGILTLPLSTNYGNNLQAFALADTLRRMGHDPILINRRRGPRDHAETDDDLRSAAARPLIAEGITLESENARNARFIDNHIGKVTGLFTSTRQLAQNIDRYGFGAIITGSDQVWRPKYNGKMLPDFFLNFLPKRSAVRRISYAASFGTESWEYRASLASQIAPMLARFTAVSVREDSAVDLCRTHLGTDAVHVLDPTLLVTRDRYVEVYAARVAPQAQDRIVTYILDPAEDKSALLSGLSEALHLPVFGTDGLPYQAASPLRGAGDSSIEHWLAAIDGARFVVTDSFHGMVFAILFRKPFLVYGNPGRGMARFTSMLALLGLQDRLVLQAAELSMDRALRPIDWSAVDDRLTRMQDISMEFLRRALTDAPQVAPGDRRAATPDPAPAPRPAAATGLAAGSDAHPLNVACTGCGACVSESCGTLRMGWTEDGFRQPVAVAADVPPEALRVCPFNPDPEPEVADEDALGRMFLGAARNHRPDAGHYERAYIGYSTAFRSESSSGGIATYIFDRLLRFGIVDHLFIVRGDAAGGYSYALFDGSEDIGTISKTRYYPVSMEELFEKIGDLPGRVALSGVACFIKAVRLKQHYHPELKSRIPFLVGIICGGLKSRHYTDFLAGSAGVDGAWHDAQYRVKNPESSASDYSFAATDDDGRQHLVRMKTLGDMWGSGLFKSRACNFCTDVLTELADLSLGDAWLPAYGSDGMGNSVMVARTPMADALIQAGIHAGDLQVAEKPVGLVVRSQQGGLDHKQGGVKFRIDMARRQATVTVPHVRPRVLADMSAGNMMVQILRERVRHKSLIYWQETGATAPFVRRMAASRRILLALSRVRKKNDQRITELAKAALADPGHLPATDLAPVRIMFRWLRRKVNARELSLKGLHELL